MSRDLLDDPGREGQPTEVMTLDGFHEFASGTALNLAQGWTARVRPLPDGALSVEADLPPWFSFEVWLADSPPDGRRPAAVIEAAIRAERDFDAWLFVRTMTADGAHDGPATTLRLGRSAPSRATVTPAVVGRQRAILLLQNPPARFTVTHLRLDDATGEGQHP